MSCEMKWINEFVKMKWTDIFLWTDNRIDGDGAHLLYDSLRYNSTLTELNLDRDCEQYDTLWMAIINNNEKTNINRWNSGI